MPSSETLDILVIEDDRDTRENLRDILELDGHHVALAERLSDALSRSDLGDFAGVVLDRRLPDGDASTILPELRLRNPGAAVVIVTGQADIQGAVAALRQGACDYILKPINPDALRASLVRAAERRRLSLAKERSEAAFRHLVEAAACVILIVRPNGALLYLSRFAEQLTGHSGPALGGVDAIELLAPEERRGWLRSQLEQLVSGAAIGPFECPILTRDGALHPVLWNGRVLPDYEGGPAVVLVGQDIRALKAAQERLVQSERLAAIGEVAAGLAHESRNALQRSQACLEMLRAKLLDRPDALDLLRRMQDAQDHLHHLYEDVRGYAAPLTLERRACQLAEVWERAWSELDVMVSEKRARLVACPATGSLACHVDPFRLGQVFRNIFENALAAGEAPVEVSIASKEAEPASGPAVQIVVSDNGPGLGPGVARRVFEPFFTTKTKGTGLGLSIARRIVEAHEGRLEAAARPGPGAEFVITLPRGPR